MSIKSTQYLYDMNTSEFSNIKYKDAIKLKYQRGKKLLYKLMEENYRTRDTERCDAVHKAMNFNLFLLDEMKWD